MNSVGGFRFWRGVLDWKIMHSRHVSREEQNGGESCRGDATLRQRQEKRRLVAELKKDAEQGRSDQQEEDQKGMETSKRLLDFQCDFFDSYRDVPLELRRQNYNPENKGEKVDWGALKRRQRRRTKKRNQPQKCKEEEGLCSTMFADYSIDNCYTKRREQCNEEAREDKEEGRKHQARRFSRLEQKRVLRNCMRIIPHLNDTGGFFIAVFRKNRRGSEVSDDRKAEKEVEIAQNTEVSRDNESSMDTNERNPEKKEALRGNDQPLQQDSTHLLRQPYKDDKTVSQQEQSTETNQLAMNRQRRRHRCRWINAKGFIYRDVTELCCRAERGDDLTLGNESGGECSSSENECVQRAPMHMNPHFGRELLWHVVQRAT